MKSGHDETSQSHDQGHFSLRGHGQSCHYAIASMGPGIRRRQNRGRGRKGGSIGGHRTGRRRCMRHTLAGGGGCDPAMAVDMDRGP